jgi:hypothetical protein
MGAAQALSGPARANDLGLDRVTPVPADQQIPVVDFVRPPILESPELNPSGSHLAARVTAGADRYQLMINEVGTQKVEMLSAMSDNDIYGFAWLGDSRISFNVGLQKLYYIGYYAADIDHLDNSYPLLQYVGSLPLSIPPADRLRPLASIAPDSMNSGATSKVVMLNSEIKTGKIYDLLTPGIDPEAFHEIEESNQKHIVETYPGPEEGLDAGYLTDKDGRMAFAFTEENGLFTMFRLVDGAWKRCPVDLETVDVIGSGRTHDEVVVLGPRQDGKPRALQYMNAATGALGDVLLQDLRYDFDGGLVRDPTTQTILGANLFRTRPVPVWFDPDFSGLQKKLMGSFPGVEVRIVSSNDAWSRVIVLTQTDRQPPIYYWVDLAKHSAGLIKKSQPWIDPGRMRAMRPFRYKTRDGRILDAYATLPAGASKDSPAPLVVIAGDHSNIFRSRFENYSGRYNWGYDEEAQFLASRGYAVLQPNTRASGGYRWMFPQSDEYDFRKIANDVTDATKTLLASELVDRRRVAVVGTEVGGYLSLASAEAEPQLYRCAVSIEGVYDWAALMGYFSDTRHQDGMYDRMERLLGDPHRDSEKFKALSVAATVDRLHIPVFVAYDAIEVFYEGQGKELASALEHAGVAHEAMQIGNDRFGINYLENKVELYRKLESFLDRNLKHAAD